MAIKTKADLEKEIEKLKLDLEEARKLETNTEAADALRDVYDAYEQAGFTSEQSFEILKIMLKSAAQPKRLLF